MSSTYDLLRQALNILQDAEQDGLPAPHGIDVNDFAPHDLSLQVPTDAEVFAAWSRWLGDEPELKTRNGNLSTVLERNGSKISIFAGAEIEGRVRELLAVAPDEPLRTAKPGDRCRILDDRIEHWDCDEHANGTVTDARTGKVVSGS